MSLAIAGLGTALPERAFTNAELADRWGVPTEWVEERCGVKARCLVSTETAASLATTAARRACKAAGVDPAATDLIVVATSSPDYFLPATAFLVQRDLEAWGAAAFDVNAACAGFVHGLAIARSMGDRFQQILVIGTDTYSKFLDWTDKNTAPLFGDGAGAVVLLSADKPGLLATVMGADGRGWDWIHVPARLDSRLKMKGRDVFRWAITHVPEVVRGLCQQAGVEPVQLDHLILHQANARITEAVARRLGLPRERVADTIEQVGNTSSASIPLALAERHHMGLVKPGDLVAMVGFGSGLAWSGALCRWRGAA